MNVIFIAITGIFDTKTALNATRLDTDKITLYNRICKDTNSITVITTRIKLGKPKSEDEYLLRVQDLLNKNGATFKVWGITKNSGRGAIYGINRFIIENIADYYNFNTWCMVDKIDSEKYFNHQKYIRCENGFDVNACNVIKRIFDVEQAETERREFLKKQMNKEDKENIFRKW